MSAVHAVSGKCVEYINCQKILTEIETIYELRGSELRFPYNYRFYCRIVWHIVWSVSNYVFWKRKTIMGSFVRLIFFHLLIYSVAILIVPIEGWDFFYVISTGEGITRFHKNRKQTLLATRQIRFSIFTVCVCVRFTWSALDTLTSYTFRT